MTIEDRITALTDAIVALTQAVREAPALLANSNGAFAPATEADKTAKGARPMPAAQPAEAPKSAAAAEAPKAAQPAKAPKTAAAAEAPKTAAAAEAPKTAAAAVTFDAVREKALELVRSCSGSKTQLIRIMEEVAGEPVASVPEFPKEKYQQLVDAIDVYLTLG